MRRGHFFSGLLGGITVLAGLWLYVEGSNWYRSR